MRIEIAWADEGRAYTRALEVAPGTTIGDAIAAAVEAGVIDAPMRERIGQGLEIAVFGKRRESGDTLFEGDRIELLGPLVVDPKLARRRRAQVRRDAVERDKWRRD
jgi:hypothetical protein